MLPRPIEKELFKVSPVEKAQLNSHRHIQDVPIEDITEEIDGSIVKSMPFWHFFENGNIAITKSNRFSFVPAHKHQFIELNYVYKGQSVQYIDDEKIILLPGQAIIFDRDVQQRIDYANRDDILLNILIRDDDTISKLLTDQNITTNLLTRFLFNASQSNFNHDNFIVLDLNSDPTAFRLMESLFIKGWNNKKEGKNDQLLMLLFRSLLIASRDLVIHQKTNFIDAQQDTMIQVISYLNAHYKDITLEKLASHFDYSPNYLGDKINKEMGHSFKHLLQMRRLNIACNLIQQTNLSMQAISERIGYDNHSSLYRLFKNLLKTTPTKYKEKVTQTPNMC